MVIKLKVSDVMDNDVRFVDSDSTVAEAIRLMVDENMWSLVVEKKGVPVGVVTERDILRRCLSKGLPPDRELVERIMTSPLITISPEMTIREAMSMLVEKNIRRLFIVEKGKIIGRVTQTRLFESSLQVMMGLSSVAEVL